MAFFKPFNAVMALVSVKPSVFTSSHQSEFSFSNRPGIDLVKTCDLVSRLKSDSPSSSFTIASIIKAWIAVKIEAPLLPRLCFPSQAFNSFRYFSFPSKALG